MTWREAYLLQAWSDFKVYRDLNAGNKSYALCHQLHYLQMTAEKLAKGFQCAVGEGPYPKTHFVFVKFLKQIKQQPLIYYSRLQFKSKKQFSSYIENLLPMTDLIEKLSPSSGDYDKMNPEYPWTDGANNVRCPVSYEFPEFRTRRRELLLIQNLLTNLFRLEGYQ
jgi:hypothetical protein